MVVRIDAVLIVEAIVNYRSHLAIAIGNDNRSVGSRSLSSIAAQIRAIYAVYLRCEVAIDTQHDIPIGQLELILHLHLPELGEEIGHDVTRPEHLMSKWIEEGSIAVDKDILSEVVIALQWQVGERTLCAVDDIVRTSHIDNIHTRSTEGYNAI